MSLKLYYDPYDINCFRGEPTTNLFTAAYPTANGGFAFPYTSSYRGIWTPNGVQTASINRYNNPGKKLPDAEITVVAVMLIVVPITVLDTFVPSVVVEFKAVALGVLIPTPLNTLIVLTSDIVAVYPEASNTVLLPR